jgi:hypothetical protein
MSPPLATTLESFVTEPQLLKQPAAFEGFLSVNFFYLCILTD